MNKSIENSSRPEFEDFLREHLPENWEELPVDQLEELSRQLKERLALTSTEIPGTGRFAKYRSCPERFAKEVLNQNWWSKQIEIAHAVRDNDRVAVKAGHSVSKTHSAAGIIIWFLHSFDPAIIVTTAPTTDQVIRLLWQEIRKQCRAATVPLLPGLKPVRAQWHVTDMWYAIGLCTDRGERFRGTHAANMLFWFDEGNGVPPFAYDEAENMCTAPGNKIVAVGNPTDPSGPFFDAFKGKSGWKTLTISALEHPNVIHGRQIYPGAASRRWVEDRISKLCMRVDPSEVQAGLDFEWPPQSGIWYRPSAIFQARVLGQFPTEAPDTLISFTSIHNARHRTPLPQDETAPVDMGVDVAYQGADACVVFTRRGQSVIRRDKWYGRDPDQAKGKVLAIARELNTHGLHIGTIAVDAIGIGAGLASGLATAREEGHLQCQRVLGVQVSERAQNAETYINRRAELGFALSERFRLGEIDLTPLGDDADDFEDQASQIKWKFEPRTGRYKIEAKDDIRKRLGFSPDDFDAMYLAFIETVDIFADSYAQLVSAA